MEETWKLLVRRFKGLVTCLKCGYLIRFYSVLNWWICQKGHKWEAIINNRSKGRGCPYYTRKRHWAGFSRYPGVCLVEKRSFLCRRPHSQPSHPKSSGPFSARFCHACLDTPPSDSSPTHSHEECLITTGRYRLRWRNWQHLTSSRRRVRGLFADMTARPGL